MKRSKHSKHPKIFLVGGLSGGPITPLLAIAEQWQIHQPEIEFVVIDVNASVGQKLAHKHGHKFAWMISGKLHRFISIKNLFSLFWLLLGVARSFYLLSRYQPIAVYGAGGFVQLPMIFAAWVMRIPRFIHQQDVKPTLSNLACAPFANLITTTFEFSVKDFPQGTGLGKKHISTNKVIWTGNPVKTSEAPISHTEALKRFNLSADLPVLLVLGGGTGALAINNLIYESLPELSKVVQIIHSTGDRGEVPKNQHNYQAYNFITNMQDAYSASTIVLSRAGIGVLSELANAQKPSIIVPMPDTHQELNAELLEQTNSAITVHQKQLTGEVLLSIIRKLLFDLELQKTLGRNLHQLFPGDAAKKIYKLTAPIIHHYAKQ